MKRVKVAGTVSLALVLLTLTAAPALALTSWSLVKAPVIPAAASSDLNGVSCTSASNCWAVGFVQTVSPVVDQTLVEHYNGKSWTLVTTPNAATGALGVLNAVACSSSSNCWAVGSHPTTGSQYTTLFEHYDGTAWSLVGSPADPTGSKGAALNGIACVSSTSCEAVGSWTNGTVFQTLAEGLSGSSFALVPSGDTSTTATNQLNGVSCTSSSSCWAVGLASVGGVYQTLAEQFSGTSWSIKTSADKSTTRTNNLTAVACPAANSCSAVGLFNNGSVNQSLAEHYNGTTWAVVASANKSTSDNEGFNAVACTSSTACWGVGLYVNGTVDQTLVEKYNGTSWSVVTSPNKTTSHNNVLNAVACPSSTVCFAAGDYNNGSVDQTLVEKFNGTSWSIVTSANGMPLRNTQLSAVTCVVSTDCWSVGNYSDGVQLRTLVENYNGKTWSVIPSPNVDAVSSEQSNLLDGVACVSTASCFAVGRYMDGSSNFHTLIEQYNGTSWSVVTGAPDPSSDPFLTAVACASSVECWAVGWYFSGSVVTLIEKYDGTSWSQVTSTSPGNQGNFLDGVACAGVSECWAVGQYRTNTADLTLVEEFTTSWSTVSSPNVPNTDNELLAVTCAAQTSCWAAGDDSGAAKTLIQHYDGTSWTIVTSPNKGTSHNPLDGVACGATNACTAVGDYNNGANDFTLIEQYNGTSWKVVSSPNEGPTLSQGLAGVACTSSSVCWAVGSWGDNFGHGQALIAHGP